MKTNLKRYGIILKNSSFALIFCAIIFALASCGDNVHPANLLDTTAQEITGTGKNKNEKFKAYNTDYYFVVIHNLEPTPQNKAKILWIGNDKELSVQFRKKVLKNLKKGDILARVVKEKKGLAVAVSAGDIEFHVYFPPEEIAAKVFK